MLHLLTATITNQTRLTGLTPPVDFLILQTDTALLQRFRLSFLTNELV